MSPSPRIISTGTRAAAGIFLGLPERPISGISLSDITIEMAEGVPEEEPAMTYFSDKYAAAGFILDNVRDSRISGCRLAGVNGDAVRMAGCDNVMVIER